MREAVLSRPKEIGTPSLNVAQFLSNQKLAEMRGWGNPTPVQPAFDAIYTKRLTRDPGNGDIYTYLTKIDQKGNATVMGQRWVAATGVYEEVREGGWKKGYGLKDLKQGQIDHTVHTIKDNTTGKVWDTVITEWGVTGVVPDENNSTGPAHAQYLATEFAEKQQNAFVYDKNGRPISGPGIDRPWVQLVNQGPQNPNIQTQQGGRGAGVPAGARMVDAAYLTSTPAHEPIDDAAYFDSLGSPRGRNQLSNIWAGMNVGTAQPLPVAPRRVATAPSRYTRPIGPEINWNGIEGQPITPDSVVTDATRTAPSAPEPTPAVADRTDEILGQIAALGQQLEADKTARTEEVRLDKEARAQEVAQAVADTRTTMNAEIAVLLVTLEREHDEKIKALRLDNQALIQQMQSDRQASDTMVVGLAESIATLQGTIDEISARTQANSVLGQADLEDAPLAMNPEDLDLVPEDEEAESAAAAEEEESVIDAFSALEDLAESLGFTDVAAKPWPTQEDFAPAASAEADIPRLDDLPEFEEDPFRAAPGEVPAHRIHIVIDTPAPDARAVGDESDLSPAAAAVGIAVLERPATDSLEASTQVELIPFTQPAPWSDPVFWQGDGWKNGSTVIPNWATGNGGHSSSGSEDALVAIPHSQIGGGGSLSSHDLFNGSGLFDSESVAQIGAGTISPLVDEGFVDESVDLKIIYSKRDMHGRFVSPVDGLNKSMIAEELGKTFSLTDRGREARLVYPNIFDKFDIPSELAVLVDDVYAISILQEYGADLTGALDPLRKHMRKRAKTIKFRVSNKRMNDLLAQVVLK